MPLHSFKDASQNSEEVGLMVMYHIFVASPLEFELSLWFNSNVILLVHSISDKTRQSETLMSPPSILKGIGALLWLV